MVEPKLLLLCLLVLSVEGYKILGIFHVATKSHNILASKLFKEIAKRGHEVTLLTPYASETPVKNLKEVPVESLQNVGRGFGTNPLDFNDATPLEIGKKLMRGQFSYSEHLLKSEQMQNIFKSNEKYDAVIVYQYLNDCLHAVARRFNAPLILFSPMPMFSSESFLLSYPMPPSYVPNILTPYTGRMNFWQRLRNSFYDSAIILYYLWKYLPKHRKLVYEYIPGNLDLYDSLNNASLALINSHVSTNEAIPLAPNAIEIGGYHIEEPEALPKDLEEFLENSKNGVIVFSMGSISKASEFPKEKKQAFIKTFSKLKMNVLWKWEEENLPGVSTNVKIMKWIPQKDVLAHPNVKVLISHGGLLSTMESVYFAKPIVGIPIWVDQKMNMALASTHEYGVEVPYRELSEKKLTWALNEILNNPKYKNNIEIRSKIMRDRPIKPVDNALYWIEHTIRHNGAPHLRYPGVDLNWFQRNLLDIVAFVVITSSTTLLVVFVFLKRLKSLLRPRKVLKKQKKQ